MCIIVEFVAGEALEMDIHHKIASQFPNLKLKRSESGKIILKFDKSESSDKLFKFLSFHPSIRVAFNSMIKAEFISVEKALPYLQGLLQNAKTSFVFEANCSICNNILDRPHIYNLFDEDITKPKSITCSKCKKVNNLKIADYNPNMNIDLKDLLKSLYRGEGNGFSIAPVKECFECGHQSIEEIPNSGRINLYCEECDSLAYLSAQVFPHQDLNILVKDKQGYWFEWFLWRLLKEEFSSDVGLLIEGKSKYDADIIVIKNGKKILIECKDTDDDSFIKKLHQIKKDFDYYLLISTCKIHVDSIRTAQNILKKKFKVVSSDKIEKINEIIKKI